jgi:hypothetical protein
MMVSVRSGEWQKCRMLLRLDADELLLAGVEVTVSGRSA